MTTSKILYCYVADFIDQFKPSSVEPAAVPKTSISFLELTTLFIVFRKKNQVRKILKMGKKMLKYSLPVKKAAE
jgi:hypothetical protein